MRCRRGPAPSQTRSGIMDGSASEEDHLVVIDRRQNRSWEEKVFHLRPGGEMPVDV